MRGRQDAERSERSLAGMLDVCVRDHGRSLLGQTFRALRTLGWMQRRLVVPALCAAVVLAVLALVPPILLAELIDKAFPSRNAALGVAIGLGIACVALTDAACSLARRMLSARAGLRLQRDMLVPAFAVTLRLPLDDALARDQGLLGRTFEEVERLAQNATEGLIEFCTAAGMIVVLAGALVTVDPLAAAAIISIVGALALLHLMLAPTLRAREAAWFQTRSDHWSHIVESIAYMNTVRVNSAHGFAERRFSERLDRDLAARLRTVDLSAYLDAAGRLAAGLVVAMIALLGGLRVMDGAMSVGDFVLVLSIGGSLAAPVLAMLRSFDDMQAMTVSVSRLSELFESGAEDLTLAQGVAERGPVSLSIDNLRFSFSGKSGELYAGLSCVFEPGERVALIGPSGIGKSTLATFIFAARRPDAGVIRLGGVPIEQIPLSVLRRRILVVPHEIDVFTGTIAENIALDVEGAAPDDIVNAARVAGLEAEIEALPMRYDTVLGQGGVDLSAGQKQRIGIARAVLRAPDILVLDESTSSLDLATERRVLDKLLEHLLSTTVIAITHRSSVVERMTRVIEIRDADI
jgi:ABC-type bacteriocin/lantibiotic exporter with double-glycine peptidase domain